MPRPDLPPQRYSVPRYRSAWRARASRNASSLPPCQRSTARGTSCSGAQPSAAASAALNASPSRWVYTARMDQRTGSSATSRT